MATPKAKAQGPAPKARAPGSTLKAKARGSNAPSIDGGPFTGKPDISSPTRPPANATIYTSLPVDIGFAGPTHRFARADLEIEGIYHGEASYEGRIFLNNPKADPTTPKTIENGYAGSFNIFGHGGCVGDAGHCEISGAKRSPNDLRNPHPLTPARKRVRVTDALKAVALGTSEATITIVPIVTAANQLCDTKNVFRCERMRFVSYNA